MFHAKHPLSCPIQQGTLRAASRIVSHIITNAINRCLTAIFHTSDANLNLVEYGDFVQRFLLNHRHLCLGGRVASYDNQEGPFVIGPIKHR